MNEKIHFPLRIYVKNLYYFLGTDLGMATDEMNVVMILIEIVMIFETDHLDIIHSKLHFYHITFEPEVNFLGRLTHICHFN